MVRKARGLGGHLDPRYAKRRRALLLTIRDQDDAWRIKVERERHCWQRICAGCGYKHKPVGREVNWSVLEIAWVCSACYIDGQGPYDRGVTL